MPGAKSARSGKSAKGAPASGEAGGTRAAIIDRLKRQGALCAAEIARGLGLTPMAVRLQLYELEKEGLAQARSEPSGRGRPTKLWSLTDGAARLFPDAHQGLAVEMIQSVEALFGAAGLKKLIERHGDIQRENYRARLSGAKTLGERVRRLAAERTREGYMAEALKDGRDWILVENHCPICSAAKECTRLCANELGVFADVLGVDVAVTREEHILAGARRCAYRVRAKTHS
ncbi:MAG: metalloregulator ArsR/SmtB family transcription factor [Parvularculaceae bacterium]|nr:transcriptional regulator [Parvularculaceae bacterium]